MASQWPRLSSWTAYCCPRLALSDELGVGLGFFPPDAASLNQRGNRDGTVDTPNGVRPNPLRYYRSHRTSATSACSPRPVTGSRLALGRPGRGVDDGD